MRTVEDIRDLETGEEIRASSLLDTMDNDDIVLLRRRLRTANRENKPIMVCAECGTKLELRCNKLSRESRGKDYYFFKHYKDVKECSIKTDSHVPTGVILARKYETVRESEPHIYLKNCLGYIIEQFHSPEKINIDNKFFFDKSGNGERRKPDIYAMINGQEFAFEIQLNTTYLSVIEEREAFYERNDVSIVWFFKYFPLVEDIRRLTQKDIYVPNRLNAFVLDDEMLDLSVREKKLHFKVFYKTFHIDNQEICDSWNNEIITLDDLKYADSYKPFFYDSFVDKKTAKRKLDKIREDEREKQIRFQQIQRLEQERLNRLEQLKQRKTTKCKEIISTLHQEIVNLDEKIRQYLESKKDLEQEIERIQFINQETPNYLNNINDIAEKMYDYFKNYGTQPSLYLSNPLREYYDITANIKEKFYEQIKQFDNSKKIIQKRLDKEIIPKKEFLEKLSIRSIGGITYSIIPTNKEYIGFVEKFQKEIKVIDSKYFGGIFESNEIYDMPDISFFYRHLQDGSKTKIFLIDMSKRKEETLSTKVELLSQYNKIANDETECASSLKETIIQLLEDELNKNHVKIKNYENKLDTIFEKLFSLSNRKGILKNREAICLRYMDTL